MLRIAFLYIILKTSQRMLILMNFFMQPLALPNNSKYFDKYVYKVETGYMSRRKNVLAVAVILSRVFPHFNQMKDQIGIGKK